MSSALSSPPKVAHLRPFVLSLAASSALALVLSTVMNGPGHAMSALAIGAAAPLCWLPLFGRRSASEAAPAPAPGIAEPVHMDEVTGLMTRSSFAEKAKEAFTEARETGRLISAVLIQVEGLEAINETWGTPAGDAVLAHVGKLIGINIQSQGDLAARYAGASFALLLPEADHDWTTAFCERLSGCLANRPVGFGDTLIPVSARFGIAAIDRADCEVDTLIRRARRQMGEVSCPVDAAPVQLDRLAA
ncbi:MAG TPA: GGDEF domain-containing protein [Beijerinckiaceae bacterium]|nr:GGDEF domain-containing protein [Beijerinckiaceae bacterium]